MARDRVNRAGDPGESEFGGDPEKLSLVSPDGPGPVSALLSAYWTNPDDPASAPDPQGSNIGDTGAQQRQSGPVKRENQFHSAPPTYPKKYQG